ncbi:protease SohB [Pseudoalteromonas sp. SSM20]|uniref:protease SohB n=1 Tax=Pseudoalteromonas sp. SSM20 TaxID=3139394 RepID=UPI003BABEA28
MEFLYEYGLFLAKTVTFVIAFAIIMVLIVVASVKNKTTKGELTIENLSENLDLQKKQLLSVALDKEAFKKFEKSEKKKSKEKNTEEKNKVFVLSFKGGIDAKEVESLRKEVTAILQIAETNDKVVVKLESGGGVVHGYGLAASQLARLKQAGLELIVSVDKIAASGGYMMACVSDKFVCAPFAMIGSIGVIAQLPNFNKLLKKNNVEFEQITAGEFKRTLTMFGENTDSGREKFKQELEQIHALFREHVQSARPELNVEQVATGETWFGTDALKMGLVDAIQTSDDLLLSLNEEFELYMVTYQNKKGLSDKLGIGASTVLDKISEKILSKSKELYH